MDADRVMVVTGATCSGKTQVAVMLAGRLDGEIVCCDSRQLFRGMEIGTAQPQAGEREAAPHHLYGTLEPAASCSAGAYREMAEPVIRGILGRKRLPILVGGTGLYLRALLGPMHLPPPADPGALKAAHAQIQSLGPAGAWNKLREADPDTAALVHPNDRYRIARALSVVIGTGRPISEWRRKTRPPLFQSIQVALKLERSVLYSRIDQRCERMLRGGLREEARKLREAGYADRDPVRKAIGYASMFSLLEGSMGAPEALALMQRDTRRYAKRQLTWLRAQSGIRYVDASDPRAAADGAADIIRACA